MKLKPLLAILLALAEKYWRVMASRVAGALMAGVATWLYERFGVQISPDDQAALAGALVTALFLIYSVVHKLVSTKTNPVDAAAPEWATQKPLKKRTPQRAQ